MPHAEKNFPGLKRAPFISKVSKALRFMVTEWGAGQIKFVKGERRKRES